jgi:lysophospholipase L1-like esterase
MTTRTKRIGAVLFVLIIGAVVAGFITARPAKKVEVSQSKLKYVALGDSVAAGDGLETASDTTACYRYQEGYPALVAQENNFELTNLSCTGATIAVGVSGPQTVNNLLLPAQFTALSTVQKPELITITVGANDLAWSGILTACYTSTCDNNTNAAHLVAATVAYRKNLAAALASIDALYKKQPPHVIVTTYYDVFAPDYKACNSTSGISASESIWWRQQEKLFDTAIAETTAEFSFASLARIDFSGHELCSADPWVQGLSAKAPFHPTDGGQKVIAQAISKAYSTR